MATFKEWFEFNENIIINDGSTEAALQVAGLAYIREFNYQFENGYSTFFVALYQAKRLGYVSISTRSTHIGITKTSPLEAGSGVDFAFLKNLTANLNASGFKSEPFKDGDSSWTDVLKQQMPDLNLTQQNGNFQQSQIPDFKQGSSNMQKVSSGMAFSKPSGSWSFFAPTTSENYALSKVLELMKKSIKPLLDNNLVEFYEIVERATGKRLEVVYSQQGQSTHDNWKNEWEKSIAYLKYLAEQLLANHPNAKQLVLNRINGVGVIVSGGGEHPAVQIKAENVKIPLEQLSSFINSSYGEDAVLLFLTEVIAKSDNYYEVLDQATQFQQPGEFLYYARKLISGYNEDDINSLGEIATILKYHNLYSELVPNYNKFLNEAKSFIDHMLEDPSFVADRNDVKNLKAISNVIELDPRLVAELDQAEKGFDDKEKEKLTQREKAKEIAQHTIEPYSVKFATASNLKWEDVKSKYVDNDLEVYHSDFLLDQVVDFEDIQQDAYEKALEDMDPGKERKSLTYGQDPKEVEEDINLEYDDFTYERSLEAPDGIDDTDPDYWINLVKTKYYDDFINWKKEKLEQEEEENSWEYEPEPDRQDIWDAAEDIAFNYAFNELGLFILKMDENKNIFIELSSKFKSQLLPLLKKTIQINQSKKDEFEERYIKPSSTITFEYVDKQQNEKMYAKDI